MYYSRIHIIVCLAFFVEQANNDEQSRSFGSSNDDVVHLEAEFKYPSSDSISS